MSSGKSMPGSRRTSMLGPTSRSGAIWNYAILFWRFILNRGEVRPGARCEFDGRQTYGAYRAARSSVADFAKASKFAGAAFSWGGELIFPKATDVEQDARMKARKNCGRERPGCLACMTNPQPAVS